jgi:hypothetical protein
MAEENQEQQTGQTEKGNDRGGSGSTAVKAAAAAAATSVAAIAAKKALSHRGDSNGQSSNGGSHKDDMGSMLSSALSGGWDAARDALVPAAEDAAGAAGEWLAENAPDFVRERIVPRFIESFNEASGGS